MLVGLRMRETAQLTERQKAAVRPHACVLIHCSVCLCLGLDRCMDYTDIRVKGLDGKKSIDFVIRMQTSDLLL